MLELRVTPKSSQDAITGLHTAADGQLSLQLKVRAQPEKGLANKAVISVMAKALGYPKSALEIVSGETDRRKSLLIRGEPGEIEKKIATLQGEQE